MGDFNGSNYKDKFIADLVQYVASDGFQSKFERFFITHALEFTGGEEHKLVYYEIYQEFSAMFESELENFCKEQDMSQAEFTRRCRQSSDTDEKVKHYISILLSSVEYETFVKLMKIMRPVAELRQMNALRAADAKSESGPVGGATSSPARRGDGKGEDGGGSPAKAAAKTAGDFDDISADDKAIEMDNLSISDSKSDSKGASEK